MSKSFRVQAGLADAGGASVDAAAPPITDVEAATAAAADPGPTAELAAAAPGPTPADGAYVLHYGMGFENETIFKSLYISSRTSLLQSLSLWSR